MTESDRPRVLILASTYPRRVDDREPRFVHELSKRLVDDFDVTVLAPHAPNSKKVDLIDGVRIRRFRYAPWGLERLAYDGGILSNLRTRPWTWLLLPSFFTSMLLHTLSTIRRENIHVIHAHWIIPQGLVATIARALSGRSFKILCTSHGSDLFALRKAHLVKKFVLKRIDALTVVSKALAEEARQFGHSTCRISVLPMGVDLDHFKPVSNSTRAENQLLFVGRLVNGKGLGVLLESVALLRKTNPGIRLEVVGEGPLRNKIEEQIEHLGLGKNIDLLGARSSDEIADRMREATIFVMPSSAPEGFGLVLVEAMSSGCPVVSSDLPAVRDIIIDGDNGKLTKPGDAVALAKTLRGLLNDNEQRAELASRAREHVSQRFSWAHVASRYRDLLSQLVRERPSSSSLNSSR